MTAPVDGGVLRVDKPVGPTSHDVVQRARRSLGIRKIGHTGTLDPFASGLLLLCVGPATRLSRYLTAADKEYVARARLGVATTTLDPEGEVVSESGEWRSLDRGRVEAALAAFRGEIDQRPPAFSAKKVGGEAAHRRVRRGEAVRLEPVSVTIHDVELTRFELPEITFRLACSSGTYVRAIARDLGDALGVGAHLVALRRTRVGPHRVEGAVSGDVPESIPEEAWLSPLEALAGWPRIEVDADEARRIAHGQRLSLFRGRGDGLEGVDRVAVQLGNRLVAVARLESGTIRPETVFPQVLEVGP